MCCSWANNTGFNPEKQTLMRGSEPILQGAPQWLIAQRFLCHKQSSFYKHNKMIWFSSLDKDKIISFVPVYGCIVLQLQTSISGWTDDAYLLKRARGCFCQSRLAFKPHTYIWSAYAFPVLSADNRSSTAEHFSKAPYPSSAGSFLVSFSL